MKTLKKVAIFLLIIAIIMPVSVPKNADAATKLNVKSKTLELGKSFNLKVSGAKKIYDIGSSNYKIVKLKKKSNKTIKVTAVGIGKATISVTAGDKKTLKTLKCKVTVKQPDIQTSIIQCNNKTYIQFISNCDKPLTIRCSLKLTNSEGITAWRTDTIFIYLNPNEKHIFETDTTETNLSLSVDYQSIAENSQIEEIETFSKLEFSELTTKTTPYGRSHHSISIKNNSEKDISYTIFYILVFSENEELLEVFSCSAYDLYAGTEKIIEFTSFDTPQFDENIKLYFSYNRLGLYD